MINVCCLLISILCKEKIEAWFVSLVSREFHGVEPTLFCKQINKKKVLKKYELLNIFFTGVAIKIAVSVN